jgi:hypothetical protein
MADLKLRQAVRNRRIIFDGHRMTETATAALAVGESDAAQAVRSGRNQNGRSPGRRRVTPVVRADRRPAAWRLCWRLGLLLADVFAVGDVVRLSHSIAFPESRTFFPGTSTGSPGRTSSFNADPLSHSRNRKHPSLERLRGAACATIPDLRPAGFASLRSRKAGFWRCTSESARRPRSPPASRNKGRPATDRFRTWYTKPPGVTLAPLGMLGNQPQVPPA